MADTAYMVTWVPLHTDHKCEHQRGAPRCMQQFDMLANTEPLQGAWPMTVDKELDSKNPDPLAKTEDYSLGKSKLYSLTAS